LFVLSALCVMDLFLGAEKPKTLTA
jgi:hypothetical protein